MNLIDDFTQTKECIYKDECYSVRDNGAVLRHAKAGKKPRKLDNIWTFGKANLQNGYLYIGNARVHRIVALAFYGEPPTKEHITDHIDTNRQNNRPQNLRYLTRLENALLNPITRSKIEYYCGSIRAFLENPSMLSERAKNNEDKNIEWMRSVSTEEAQHCLKNLQLLSSRKKDLHQHFVRDEHSRENHKMGEWIYKPIYPQEINNYDIKALSPNVAVQRYWTTASEFILCPKEISDTPLEDYFRNLKRNANLTKNHFNSSRIVKFEMSENKDAIFVLCQIKTKNKKPYAVTKIIYENKFFVHINCGYIAEQEKTRYKELIPKLEEAQKAKHDFLLQIREQDIQRQQETIANEINFNIADCDIQAISPNIAKQRDWRTPTEFPLCPKESSQTPLEEYFYKLQKGALFSQNKNNSATVLDFALSSDTKSLFVVCGFQQDTIKPYALVEIIYENNIFVHINRGSFFEEQGAEKYFTLAQGREWRGGEVFDDFC
ncbi:HNH endonuclease signature motif containing protein [Helicobacter sp. T3_23-1059]